MTEVERAIAAKRLAEKMVELALKELEPIGEMNEEGTIAMMAATSVAVTFAATRNMDARATLAEINVLAARIAADVHGNVL